jgi:hypothetical protein
VFSVVERLHNVEIMVHPGLEPALPDALGAFAAVGRCAFLEGCPLDVWAEGVQPALFVVCRTALIP